MKKIVVRFEEDASFDHIDIVIRARKKDAAVEKLMRELTGHPPGTLAVYDEDGKMCVVSEQDIVLASVNGKNIQIITESGIYTVRQTLQNLEDSLEPRRFIRVSRFEIVNLEKVRKYDFTIGGTLRLELAGGIETWASRRCISAIRNRLLGKE